MRSAAAIPQAMGNPERPPQVLIVGAGLAGLSCAARLHQAGVKAQIFESSDEVGGRVRTDQVDGFLLDRGFQVFLDAYPNAGRILDCDRLRLRAFRPGALLFRSGKFHRMMDVFRSPSSIIGTALAPIGTLRDKLLVARLRRLLMRSSCEEIAEREASTTEGYLRDFAFSPLMIDGFFRSFNGGVF